MVLLVRANPGLFYFNGNVVRFFELPKANRLDIGKLGFLLMRQKELQII